MSEVKYFNFPVQLLDRFLINSHKRLEDITDYAIYEKSLKVEKGTVKDRIKESASFYNMTLGSIEKTLNNGQELYNSIPTNSPKVGLSLSIFWEYYKKDKTEFDKVCLLAFLALKSILGNKAYCKTTVKFWLSRMDGKCKQVNEYWELSPEIEKFSNEYQTKKIKTALRNGWELITYSRFCRGFYISFKISLGQLILEAEKRRISTKEKQYKAHEQETLKQVKELLNRTRP
jgi:hypothetical protein